MVELVASSATRNNIAYKYLTKKAGEYELIFLDGSQIPLTTIVYKVHPLQTRWLSTASNSDWNKWDNWSDGSPYCCTNAIISSDAQVFPKLGLAMDSATYCCKDIFFEPRSAVENIPSLNYRMAWVEMELPANRYYNLSAPLKQMYTGDMFVPAGAYPAYFEPLTEDNCEENRFNPSVYQRLWATTAPGKMAVKNNGAITLQDNTLGVVEGKWSRHFNAVAKPYAMGEGFSVWVDNGEKPATDMFSIRLPKTHTTYHYYADYDQEKLGSETLTRVDTLMHRFVYETEHKDNKLMKYEYLYRQNDKDEAEKLTEMRKVYVGLKEYQITLKADAPTNTFLMGNPFMSHINIEKFFKVNNDVVSVRVDKPEGEVTFARSGKTIVSTGDYASISPLQSFFVVKDGEAVTELTLLLTTEMIGAPVKMAEIVKPEDIDNTEKPKALRVNVESILTGSKSASLLMLTENTDEETAAIKTMMDGEVKANLKVFGISQNNAYDIMPMAESTSLGIFLNHKDSISIEVVPTEGVDEDEFVLHDRITGKDYPLGKKVVIADAETSIGRFVVRKTGLKDDADNVSDNICIMQEGSYAVVQSAIENLKSVEVRDASGRLISKVQGDGSQRLRTKITSGVQIVSIELTDGGRASYKMMFN